MAEVVRAAIGVALVLAERVDRRQRARQGRVDLLARRGDVVVDAVAVGELRHVAGRSERAHADDVGERRRIAREGPGRLRRLVRVADSRDEHRAAADRVVDRARLDLRERVPAWVERIAQAADREVDHPCAGVDGPPDRLGLVAHVDRLIRARDLRDHQLRRKRDSGDAFVVVQGGADHPGDEGAVSFLVGERAPTDPAPGLRPDSRPWKLRVAAVEPRVDDRHAHGIEHRQVGLERVERVVLRQVVLLRREWVAREEPAAYGQGCGGRRQEERQGREYRCLHGVVT